MMQAIKTTAACRLPRRLIAALLGALLSSVCPLSSAAERLTVEGSAVIEHGDIGKARLAAQQNALQQAAMQRNARVESFTATGAEGIVIDQVNVRSSLNVRALEPLDERVEGELLTVQMSAELAAGPCGFPAAAFRKKIAAVYFPIEHPQQIWVRDYYGYERGIANELLRQLAATGLFLTRDASELSLYLDLAQAPAVIGSNANGQPLTTQLLYDKGVQFVVSGVLRDLSFSLPKTLFSRILGELPEPRDRHLEIEFFIHDTLSGELLGRHRHALTAEGSDVVPLHPTPFGSRAFYASKYGRLFQQVLNLETQAITQLLQCRPFVTQVLKTDDGNLYLDAGADTLIRVGDILTAYAPDIRGPIFGADGQVSQFGWPKTTLRIIKVFPGYAVSEPESQSERMTLTKGQFLNVW